MVSFHVRPRALSAYFAGRTRAGNGAEEAGLLAEGDVELGPVGGGGYKIEEKSVKTNAWIQVLRPQGLTEQTTWTQNRSCTAAP